MLIRVTPDHPIRSSDITPEDQYVNRRAFLKELMDWSTSQIRNTLALKSAT